MGTSTAFRQCGLLSLVTFCVLSTSQSVLAGKISAEESESSNSGGSSSQLKDGYSLGGEDSPDKYSTSYPSSAFSYYSTYGYPGSANYPFVNSAGGGGGGVEHRKSIPINTYHSEPFYERTAKDFSTRTSNNMPMAMAASSNFGNFGAPGPHNQQSKEVNEPEFGGLASASQGWGSEGHGGWGGEKGGGGGGWGGGGGGWGGGGGGWGGGGGGGGWGKQGGGWGKGGGGGGGGYQVDKNGIGALTVVAFLSLLSSILRALATTTVTTTTTTTTTMAAGRKKRDLEEIVHDDPLANKDIASVDSGRISMMVLPSLNVIAHAREGRVPLECTHREVCIANSILVKELGFQGRSVGSMISNAIKKCLKEMVNSGPIGKHIDKAGLTGRNGHNCTHVYPLCEALGPNGRPILPMLLPPAQVEEFTRTNHNRLSTLSKPDKAL